MGSVLVLRAATTTRMATPASAIAAIAAGHADQGALDDQLADDAASRRAEREAHGQFGLARRRAHQRKTRDIGAGGEEHECGDAEQQPERVLVLGSQRRDAVARRPDREPQLHELFRAVGVVVGWDHRLQQRRAKRCEVRVSGGWCPSGREPAHDRQPPVIPTIESRGADGERHLETAAHLHAQEGCGNDADDGVAP